VAPGMCQRGSGSIINIALDFRAAPAVSRTALQYGPRQAMIMMTQSYALELAPRAFASMPLRQG